MSGYSLCSRVLGANIPLILLLSACTPGRINYVHIESPYDASQDHWVPYSRSLHADITGNPFPVPQDDFNRAVNTAIQAKGIDPSPSGYRIRMIFNGAPTNGNYICGETGQTGGAAGHSQGRGITLSAAYCRGSDTMTFLQGSVDNITGPDDPRFHQFLRMVATQLFPLPTGNNNDNCMFTPFGFCR
ncbi:MAG TPA: hypothetical protein VM659_14665 [Dongiaceae bacterium]|nr:hypothetical protein [Dongiaceae bacterium]